MARYFGTNIISGDLPTFTQAQIDSINSGITDIEVASYNTHINNSTIHVTSTDKTNWDNAVHKTGDETVAGIKTFNTAPRFRNDLTPSTSTTKSETIEDVLLQTTLNTNNIIDGASIIRSQSTSGNREVHYRAGFRTSDNTANRWPSLICGIDTSDDAYTKLSGSYSYAPQPNASNSTSIANIATCGWVNDTTKSTNVVHRDSAEDITGTKTIKNSSPTLYYQNTTMDITSSGWTAGRNTIAWCKDKNGNETGGIYNRIESGETSVKTSMYAMSRKSGSQVNASITVGVDDSGNVFTVAPTPATSDNSTKIATTAFVRNREADIVHKSGAETIRDAKTFIKDSSSTTSTPIVLKNTNVEQLTVPSAYNEQMLFGVDTNGVRIGSLGIAINAEGKSRCYMGASKYINNEYVYSIIDTYVDINGNCTCNLPANTYGTYFHGTADYAKWADLAEKYQSDQKYPVGTLIRFGGGKDITIANINCNGVISDKPGYLLDSELEDSQPVALVGKTPIRILGKVKKFDRIVLDPEHPGIGKVQTTSEEKIIAIALEDSNLEEEKLVKCVTKFNLD